MQFTKLQATGNDFVLIEAGTREEDWGKLAQAICRHHYGVGADGLLLLLSSDSADFKMRVFNPDGSQAEACGNGTRCCARYITEKTNTGGDRILLETDSGVREIKLRREGGRIAAFRVGMGQPEFAVQDIPAAVETATTPVLDYPVNIDGLELPLSLVSLGNPHAVYFDPDPVDDFPLSRLGPKVEEHRIFPNRTNFEVAMVVSRQQIEARVWERGAGETLACGSGACAIAVMAQLHGYTGENVNIKMPGGVLGIEWSRGGEVYLSGPAEIVFTGEWRQDTRL